MQQNLWMAESCCGSRCLATTRDRQLETVLMLAAEEPRSPGRDLRTGQLPYRVERHSDRRVEQEMRVAQHLGLELAALGLEVQDQQTRPR